MIQGSIPKEIKYITYSNRQFCCGELEYLKLKNPFNTNNLSITEGEVVLTKHAHKYRSSLLTMPNKINSLVYLGHNLFLVNDSFCFRAPTLLEEMFFNNGGKDFKKDKNGNIVLEGQYVFCFIGNDQYSITKVGSKLYNEINSFVTTPPIKKNTYEPGGIYMKKNGSVHLFLGFVNYYYPSTKEVRHQDNSCYSDFFSKGAYKQDLKLSKNNFLFSYNIDATTDVVKRGYYITNKNSMVEKVGYVSNLQFNIYDIRNYYRNEFLKFYVQNFDRNPYWVYGNFLTEITFLNMEPATVKNPEVFSFENLLLLT